MGAHRLARAEDDAALGEFAQARERAGDAADNLNELLNAGYAALVGALGGCTDAEDEFASVVERLRNTPAEDARSFAVQLEKAFTLLGSRGRALQLSPRAP